MQIRDSVGSQRVACGERELSQLQPSRPVTSADFLTGQTGRDIGSHPEIAGIVGGLETEQGQPPRGLMLTGVEGEPGRNVGKVRSCPVVAG